MKNAALIFAFTLAVTAFYNYVGQLVPQKEVHPPKSAEVRSDMSTAEMVEAGQILVAGKGTCLNCHNGSQRFPLLEGVGARAKTAREGMSDLDYLAESLYEPNEFIIEPFAPGMPPVNKPPIGLSDQEILAVIAFLQSLGGTPTVTMETKLKYQGAAAAPAAPAAGADPADANLDGKGLFTKYGCMACHSVDAPVRLVGPSLFDLGTRQSTGEIYQAIVDPDAVVAEGYPPGVMGATLTAGGFYDKLSPKQLKMLVDYLASLKG